MPTSPDHRLATIDQARRALMLRGEVPSASAIEPWIAGSWQRCLQRGQRPRDRIGFDVVSAAAMARTTEAAHALRSAAASMLADLTRVIAPTRYFSILTNQAGVVVAIGGNPDFRLPAVRSIARIGVDLSERSVGTTAISAALAEQHPVWLHRGEHFFDATSVYSCAGAPIFGPDGRCAGMLDLTGVQAEERSELRHLVAQMAQRVEHALLLAHPHRLLLQLLWPGQAAGAGAGLLAVDGDARIVGASRSAIAMLGLRQSTEQGFGGLDDVFATDAAHLMSLRASHAPTTVPLWTGLQLAVARLEQGSAGIERDAPMQPAATRLRDTEAELIRRAVDAARGNVAEAARQLGISRATVYRRMQAAARKGK